MKKLLTSLLAFTTIGLGAQAPHKEVDKNDPRLKQRAEISLTAEQILNGQLNYHNPYQFKLVYDLTGFAIDKLHKLPAKGVHPRLVVTPDDMADAYSRLNGCQYGRKMVEVADNELSKMRGNKGEYAASYNKLLKGTIAASEFKPANSRMMNYVAVQGLLSQMRNNKELLAESGRVAANYIISLTDYIATLDKIEGLEEHIPEAVYQFGNVAKLYDFTAAGMTSAQRTRVADAISKVCKNRFVDGMELPAHWRRWNHIAMAICAPLTIAAIDKESKFTDKRLYDRGLELTEDYLTYTYSPQGVSTEGMNYTLGQVPNVLSFMVAAARKGDKNMFGHPHLRAVADWIIYTMSPNPDALWTTSGDTGTRSIPPFEMLMILKNYYPNDAKIDYIVANAMPQKITSVPDVVAYACFNMPLHDKKQYNGTPPVDMPLTYSSMQRGMFIARDRWAVDGVKFAMEARTDTFFPSHDHSDRGAFTLSANGRDWIVDAFRSTEGKYHSVITIDGRGQGYFATPASWLYYTDKKEATFGVVDYKYCFDWMWLKTPVADILNGVEVPAKWAKGVYGESAAELKRYFPNIKPERDPLEGVVQYYNSNLRKNALIWKEDSWPERVENYPVSYAFRSGGVIKGKHTYMLIVDDLKKDDTERLYEWCAPMPMDVELISIKQLIDVKMENGPLNIGFNTFSNANRGGEYDMLFGDKSMSRDMRTVDNEAGFQYKAGTFKPNKGDKMLLVRLLDKEVAARPNLEPCPSLQTIEHLKTEDMHQFYMRTMGLGKRLVIPSRSTKSDFKVLIFPHLSGDELPVTTWSNDRKELEVRWSDQIDNYTFEQADNNRTKIVMKRDGKVVFDTK